MRAAIDTAIAAVIPASVFGSVGTAAEIIFAEAALDAGIAVEIVLPVRLSALKAAIAKDAGEAWASRVEACCARAQRLA